MGLREVFFVNELIIAVVGAVGAVKSAYNGTVNKYVIQRLRKAEEAHERTQEIENKVDEIQDHQQIQTDALIQIGEITGEMNGHDFDADLLREEMGREETERFIEEND